MKNLAMKIAIVFPVAIILIGIYRWFNVHFGFPFMSTAAAKKAVTKNRDQKLQDIMLSTRDDAENVLDALDDVIDEYGFASMNDLYDVVGLTGGTFRESKYGWNNLSSAGVRRIRGGYTLSLPPTKEQVMTTGKSN